MRALLLACGLQLPNLAECWLLSRALQLRPSLPTVSLPSHALRAFRRADNEVRRGSSGGTPRRDRSAPSRGGDTRKRPAGYTTDVSPPVRTLPLPFAGSVVFSARAEADDADAVPGRVASKHFFSQKGWQSLSPPPSGALLGALGAVMSERPSRIQVAAWGAVRGGGHTVIADQTGSGKTLAYLLPLFEALLVDPPRDGSSSRGGRVRGLILCPTTELAQQVGCVARALAAGITDGLALDSACGASGTSGISGASNASGPGHRDGDVAEDDSDVGGTGRDRRRRARGVRVAVATGGTDRPLRTQKAMLLDGGVDLLVATVGRAAALVGAGALDLSACGSVVLDEVDVLLLDASFPLAAIGSAVAPKGRPELSIGSRAASGVDSGGPGAQFVFVTATLPLGVMEQLKLDFGGPGGRGLAVVTGPGLHKVSPLLKLEVIDCGAGAAARDAAVAAEAYARAKGGGDDVYADPRYDEDDGSSELRHKTSGARKGQRVPSAPQSPRPSSAESRGSGREPGRVNAALKAAVLIQLLGTAEAKATMRTVRRGGEPAVARTLRHSTLNLHTPRTVRRVTSGALNGPIASSLSQGINFSVRAMRCVRSSQVVFCNSLSSCRFVENALTRADRRSMARAVLPLHAAIPEADRAKALGAFARPERTVLQPMVRVVVFGGKWG